MQFSCVYILQSDVLTVAVPLGWSSKEGRNDGTEPAAGFAEREREHSSFIRLHIIIKAMFIPPYTLGFAHGKPGHGVAPDTGRG